MAFTKFKILYASTGGQSHDLAKRLFLKIGRRIDAYRLERGDLRLVAASSFDSRTEFYVEGLDSQKTLWIIVMPTYGDGEPPDMARVILNKTNSDIDICIIIN